jgi:hypothetical protein
MLAAGLQSVDTDNSSNEFFHLPELGCDDDITFSVLRSEDSENVAEDAPKMETVKITRMRTPYKKLRGGL